MAYQLVKKGIIPFVPHELLPYHQGRIIHLSKGHVAMVDQHCIAIYDCNTHCYLWCRQFVGDIDDSGIGVVSEFDEGQIAITHLGVIYVLSRATGETLARRKRIHETGIIVGLTALNEMNVVVSRLNRNVSILNIKTGIVLTERDFNCPCRLLKLSDGNIFLYNREHQFGEIWNKSLSTKISDFEILRGFFDLTTQYNRIIVDNLKNTKIYTADLKKLLHTHRKSPAIKQITIHSSSRIVVRFRDTNCDELWVNTRAESRMRLLHWRHSVDFHSDKSIMSRTERARAVLKID